ncbi:hypothetical protein [Archangium lansingense]|uniref:Uncharacterized protein n=1 Tax=Archangium lansingense TaxID=2995310 RepID=A0ABT4AHC8_9BACT|nr:hypothetical protein [Archangium lansinium]MCY1080599.1 hypothetical protein [Archangium lansinium]
MGNLGPISANTWVEYDVTGVLAGDPPSALLSFGLLPESSDGVDFVSRDSVEVALHPHLALTLETAPFCTYRGTGGGLTGWVRQSGGMGPEVLQALATDSGGGIVAAGRFGDTPFSADTGFALARLTADGSPLWTRQVTTGDVRVRAITVTPEGHILAVGDYSGSPDLGSGPLTTGPVSRALFIAKFSSSGQTEWARGFVATFDRNGEFEFFPLIPNAVATDAQGSLVVGGRLQGRVDFGGGAIFAGSDSVDAAEAQEGGFVAKFSTDGQHVWSRAFEAGLRDAPVRVSTVATDSAGHVLVGGRANTNTNLGNGPVGELVPFIAKYEAASGALLWSRLFSGSRSGLGNVVSVQSLGADTVAFAVNLGGVFTFGGSTFTVSLDEFVDATDGFVGTLGATGADGWIRQLKDITLQQLVTGSDGTLTFTGHDGEVDLGGGSLGSRNLDSPFVARYSSTGAHLWSRHFDANFFDEEVLPFFDIPRLRLASQPGGSVVVGGSFSDSVLLDGRTFTAEGSSDILFLQLKP